MASLTPAVGRPVGSLTVDTNGLPSYHYKINVPKGIGHGNEPDLALVYTHGASNGILGKGWAIAGLSSIRVDTSSTGFSFNEVRNEPIYEQNTLRMSLDGQALLNIEGEYGNAGTKYKTEIDNHGTVVSALENGFLLKDATGVQLFYGITSDSRVTFNGGLVVKEWRLKKRVDPHGNAVQYNYVPSLAEWSSGREYNDSNISYIHSIVYTSNERTGYEGQRLVLFKYAERQDPAVHSALGETMVRIHLLTSIQIAMRSKDGNDNVLRSYDLDYTASPVSGSSHLVSIQERSYGKSPEFLTPTVFDYTGHAQQPEELFVGDASSVAHLQETNNTAGLVPLNISGRCLADLACVRYDSQRRIVLVNTFLAHPTTAQHQDQVRVTWGAHIQQCHEATPCLSSSSYSMPTVYGADLNGNGRSDLVVPFNDSGSLSFSISQSTGTGFRQYSLCKTRYEWCDKSTFVVADLSGNAVSDIIQIFSYQGKVAFRVFTAVGQNGEVALDEGRCFQTKERFSGTLKWMHFGNTLLRIYDYTENPDSYCDLSTFAFPRGGDTTSSNPVLLEPVRNPTSIERVKRVKHSVHGFDMSVQGLVTCLADHISDGPECKINFTISTFPSDGIGRFLLQDQSKTFHHTKSLAGHPASLGTFHVMKLYGTNEPSLVYVYQELESQDHVGIVFTWSSAGLVNEQQSFRIAQPKGLPSGEISLVPADLNGTSLSDWLMYSKHKDGVSVYPIYNTAKPTDHLVSVRDSMGLRSEIEYEPISNPLVYTPTVAWDAHGIIQPVDNHYPVISACRYVVSRLNMTNDPSINRLPYSNSVQKIYSGAVVDRRGRGWQGFAKVQTYDQLSNSTTSQSLLQKWPLTGCPENIYIGDGRFSESKSLSKQTFEYDTVSTTQGTWKIFKIHRTAELRNYLSHGIMYGQSGTRYSYDEESNVIEEEVCNSDGSVYWTKFSYQRFQNLVPLRTCKKVTSMRENCNFEAFEDGDLSMTRVSYDARSGILTKVSNWSSSVNQFTSKSFEFDEYGNEVKTVDEMGLTTCTTFDDAFHTYPITVSETGIDVNLVSNSAYDRNTGAQIATLETDGSLTCSLVDSFGRTMSTRMTETDPSEEGIKAMQCFLSQELIGSQALAERLSTTSASPHTDISVKSLSDSNGAYILARTISSHKPGPDGQVETIRLIDCTGVVRKTAKKHGNLPHSWVYSEYDSRGCNVLQSFPTKLPGCQDSIAPGLEWVPGRRTCIATTFDALKRQTSQTRPSHQDQNQLIDTRLSYLEGGTKVQKTIKCSSGATLSKTEKHYARINGKEKMVAMVDENGSKTTYAFDVLGRLTRITDPAGKIESRIYGSLGNLEKTCDPYRGTVIMKYDLGGNPIEKINAVEDTVKYSYDCKGRVKKMTGRDRSVVYQWDNSGLDAIQSITMHDHDQSDGDFESKFQFQYDRRGRILSKTVLVPFHYPSYQTVYAYDWQDQIVEKTLPDESKVSQKYSGALLSGSDLDVDGSKMNVAYEQYNSFETPEKWTVSSNGVPTVNLDNAMTYDTQGFPLSHTVDAKAALVNDKYTFNDLDQLTSTRDTVSHDLTNYTYQAGRLASVKTNEDVGASYSFDPSGNITQKGNMQFQYSAGSVLATIHGDEVAKVEYDAAGRMVRRRANDQTFTFDYDGFGHMSSIHSKDGRTRIIYDYEGHVLAKMFPDGTQHLHISQDFEVSVNADASCRIKRKLYGADRILGVLCSDPVQLVVEGEQLSYLYHTVEWFHTNIKGNITRVFCSDGVLKEKSDYYAFGQPMASKQENESSTYEGNAIETQTGLLDFDARWYDPLIGRFATPDDILDEKSLSFMDGINRYAFENNDPINHIDPTGHWSWKSWTGLAIGAGLVVGGIIALATLPVSLPAAIVTGALLGAGGSAIGYSWSHRDDFHFGQFFTHVAVGATVGAVTGGAAQLITNAVVSFAGAGAEAMDGSLATQTWTRVALYFGGRAMVGAVTSGVSQVTNNVIDEHVWGDKSVHWSDDVLGAMGWGAALGVATAVGSTVWESEGPAIKAAVAARWNYSRAQTFCRGTTKALWTPAQKLLRGSLLDKMPVAYEAYGSF